MSHLKRIVTVYQDCLNRILISRKVRTMKVLIKEWINLFLNRVRLHHYRNSIITCRNMTLRIQNLYKRRVYLVLEELKGNLMALDLWRLKVIQTMLLLILILNLLYRFIILYKEKKLLIVCIQGPLHTQRPLLDSKKKTYLSKNLIDQNCF